MKKYYINNGSEQEGPFDLEELKGKINRDTMVWYEGATDWVKADDVVDLKTVFSTPPPLKKEVPPPTQTANSTNSALDITDDTKGKRKRRILALSFIVFCALAIGAFFFTSVKEAAKTEAIDEINSQKAIEEMERQEREVKDKAQRMLYVRNHITEFIYSEGSGYSTSLLGGISGYFVTVRNNTMYSADITVKVTYVKNNGVIYDTKYLYFYNVPAKGTLQEKAPDTPWGRTVTNEITDITSKGLDLCYSSEQAVPPGDSDPYQCR